MNCATTPTTDCIKRGDTFTLTCIYKVDAVATSVAAYTIRSQVRDSYGALIEELTATKANQVTSPGVFTLSAAAPIEWPIDILYCDIEFVEGGVIRSTQTFKIPVEQDVTLAVIVP